MKNNWLYLLAGVFLMTACSKVEPSDWNNELSYKLTVPEIEPLQDRNPLSREEIDAKVLKQLQTKDEFRWSSVDDYTLWSAATQTDSLISIGYQPEGYSGIDGNIHRIDVNDKEWAEVKEALINFILEELSTTTGRPINKEEILAFGDKPLPYFNVKMANYEVLAKLRGMKEVRYVEPMSFGTELTEEQRAQLGCGDAGPASVPSSDYTTVSPNAKVSWNYYDHNIPAAWDMSQGDNISVGVIDTGVSSDQNKLNSQFSSGSSTSRWRDKLGFFESCWWWWCSNDGPNDDCGHGTAMTGTIAAPRTSAGNSVGVAYKANIVSCRGTDDVVINSGNEKDGVSDSFYYLGSRSDIKIISMSCGDVFYSGQVADAINYAHNQGKLLFCAAGTSLSWTSWWGVIFPAYLSNTVAVTGIKTGLPTQRCSNCHDGSAVDFVVTMEDRYNSNRTPITLAMYSNTPTYTGGSSVATATTAGMAALVWAEDPSMNRDEVLQVLKESAENYPSRDGNFGWGRIDALDAVTAAQ